MTTPAADDAGVPQRRRSRRILLVTLAVGIGAVLSVFAPSDWPEGLGSLILDDGGTVIIDVTVSVGTTDAIAAEVTSGDTRYVVEVPDGITTNAPVRAAITVETSGTVRNEPTTDLILRIVLSDGRTEVIPVVGFDDASNAMIAIRRPPKDSSLALGLLGFVAVLWVSEAVPLFVTSLAIPVVLVFSGSVDATDATAPFFHPIIVLFFAGFLMAEAMARSRLDRRVAVTVTARAGTSPVMLFATLIGLTAAMSMFMSNTAAAAVMVPIAVAITAPLDSAGFRKMVVLGIAYAATIGGVGSAIGTPGNQLAIEFLGEFTGRIVTFNEWFLFGLPMVICFLPLAGAYLWVTGDGRIDPARFVRAREAASAEYAKLGRPTRDETTVTAVFALVMIGWITQSAHGVHPGIVALAGAIVLFALGELQPNDLGRISWASLLTFGGGLTLGSFLVASGTSDALATNLGFLADVPTALAVTLVAIITVVLTTFASNTASAAILIPLAIPLAGVLGIDPTGLVILVAIASSIDFAFVVGTPPTMIAYSTGLFTAGTIFRKGIVLDLVGVILLSLVVTQIWNLFGLV